MADDMEYLQPSFDASSITVPKLRNILMTHDVRYPASAKKPELIEVFNKQIKPKSRKLLAARDRVRRTSEGIIYIPSSQESSVDADEEDRASMPPPPIPNTPKRRKSRKSTRAISEDRISEASSSRNTPAAKRSTSKQARHSDTDSDADLLLPQPSRSRQRNPPPATMSMDEDATPRRPKLNESAFSDENPFQSGSSPLVVEANRRRTTGSDKSRQRSSSDRRKTEGAALSGTKVETNGAAIVPSTKSFEVPVSRLKGARIKSHPKDELEPGEEFTPDERRDLLLEQQSKGGVDPLPYRNKKVARSRNNVPKSLPWMVLTTLLGGYATWYRQEKLAVGYCGIGHPSDAISTIAIPEWADALRPTCEMCPQHAVCYENLETRCEDGFLLQTHPLSLGGLVPIAPTCEPDGEKARKIKRVADKAVEKLRERNAEAECGTLVDSTGKLETADIPEQELKDAVAKQRRKGMSEAEFEDLWKGAIGEIVGREEVVQVGRSSDGDRLASTSLAQLPFGCSLRRSARLTMARYRVPISILGFFVFLALYTRRKILQSRADKARVPGLIASTLDRLATQAAIFSRGDSLESWISVGQLRDDVLRDEFSDARRESIWRKVQAVVERNANIRASSKELRGGDVSRVWEWIGSIGLLEDPGFSVRKSGGKRVSWGGAEEASEQGQRKASPLNDEATSQTVGKSAEQRKWDEGRPIY